MDQATVQVKVAERNAEVGQTSNGKAKLGIKTANGKWLQVTGSGVENIKVGQDIVVSEPKQFGKSWFADLKEIKTSQLMQQTNGAAVPALRFDAKSEKMTWDDFERTFRAAHAMVMECEPDGLSPEGVASTVEGEPPTFVVIDRSQARASLMATIIIALTKDGGRIEPTEAVPF